MANPRSTGEILRQRFDAKWQPRENGCHVWTGRVNASGYGTMQICGRTVRAHRLAYEFAYGPIPTSTDEEIVVRHKCDNPPCVNPEHLELGTRADNNRDTSERGRHWLQKKTHCAKGHPLSGDNLYNNPAGFRQCRTCADACKRAYGERKRIERGAPPRVSAEQTAAICDDYSRGGISQRQLGLKYGLSQGWISTIISRGKQHDHQSAAG